MKKRFLIAFLGPWLFLAGCGLKMPYSGNRSAGGGYLRDMPEEHNDQSLPAIHQDIAGKLAEGFRQAVPGGGGPVVAATFVDLNDLEKSNALGRQIAEWLANGLSREGLQVMDLRLHPSEVAFSAEVGETVLSRQAGQSIGERPVFAFVTGTYSGLSSGGGTERVYVNARVLRASDGKILASADYQLSFPIGSPMLR